MSRETLLSYYQDHAFNPVPIALEDAGAWRAHHAKRHNLIENHLKIPLALLRGREVLEFGCNSGENALVLAAAGARLTLVEPNGQVLPRLRRNFARFGLEEALVGLHNATIGDFQTGQRFDLVVAEGFLNTLPDRDDLLLQIIALIRPGGLGILSFDDRHGALLEQVRRMALWRACRLAGIGKIRSSASLAMAGRLFREDFNRLNASRPFEAWWEDELINPFASDLWSLREILPILGRAGCGFHAASPLWDTHRHHAWYKDVPDAASRQARLLDDLARALPYFLTGCAATGADPAADAVIATAGDLTGQLAAYVRTYPPDRAPPDYPETLGRYLSALGDPPFAGLDRELRALFAPDGADSADRFVERYLNATTLRRLWGTVSHYVSFVKTVPVPPFPAVDGGEPEGGRDRP